MLIILPSINEEAGRLLSHLAALPLQSNCAWASSVSRTINFSCSWKQAALIWTTLQLRSPDLLTREQGGISLAWWGPGWRPAFHLFFFFFFFAVSHLTGRDFWCCFENQDVVRTWWDPWGNGWTFEPVCRDGRGSIDSIKWPSASELSLMGVNIDIWAQSPTAIHLSNFANHERKQHPSVCDNSKQIDNRLFL